MTDVRADFEMRTKEFVSQSEITSIKEWMRPLVFKFQTFANDSIFLFVVTTDHRPVKKFREGFGIVIFFDLNGNEILILIAKGIPP